MGSAIGDAIGQWYEASGGEETADYYWEGRHVGTQYGEQAADWYARKYLEATTSYGKAGYYTLGLFASLWTPESWKKTASVIVAAGSAAEPASKAKPWLGTAGFHPPHHGMGRHLEVIIRVGAHKVLKIFIPGAKQAIKFIIQ